MEDTYRMTRQRKIILAILDQAATPLTAEAIADHPQARAANMALSTVYRNLERLSTMAIVSQLRFLDGIARYERYRPQHHHYLICTRCQACQIIAQCPMHTLQSELERTTGYQITSHQLNVFGLCPQCRAHLADDCNNRSRDADSRQP